jgi:L-lactate dehydrogenase complex protein LldG
MSRESFLTRVRQAAQMGRAYRVQLHDVPAGTGYVGAGEDLCAAMASEVDAVGGVAHVVEGHDAARQTLQALLNQYQPTSALCWQHPVLDRLDVAELLAAAGITLHNYETLVKLDEAEQRSLALAAGVGISSADLAIAETGTLMVCARPGQERIASLLPPVHVAIIEQSQIVPDLFDAITQLAQRGLENLPSNIALITGPSKTGDIELQLTTGVHGPGKWHVILVRSQ